MDLHSIVVWHFEETALDTDRSQLAARMAIKLVSNVCLAKRVSWVCVRSSLGDKYFDQEREENKLLCPKGGSLRASTEQKL